MKKQKSIFLSIAIIAMLLVSGTILMVSCAPALDRGEQEQQQQQQESYKLSLRGEEEVYLSINSTPWKDQGVEVRNERGILSLEEETSVTTKVMLVKRPREDRIEYFPAPENMVTPGELPYSYKGSMTGKHLSSI